MRTPRVAYFPDSFHEVNGVAHTSRNFVAYAERHQLPFLCVRAGGPAQTFHQKTFTQSGELRTLELARSRTTIRLERDLEFDALFWRHVDAIDWQIKLFQPDIIHITGPSELGIFGAIAAYKMKIPLAASWHTNVHEYLARRMGGLTRRMPSPKSAEGLIESATLRATTRFYSMAKVLFAPNRELCSMLETATGTPCHLMRRGVDTGLFHPARRTRRPSDQVDEIVLGYVGRLSIEKNVTLLARVQAEVEGDLHARGIGVKIKLKIIGQGGDEELLRRAMPAADFTGVLRGEALALAYADMDLLVFPSHTDTFGNVVLEALASGVPAVVTPDGGPKYIVEDGVTGFVTADDGFSSAVASVILDRSRLRQMGLAARAYAEGCSWDAVFDRVYAAYDTVLGGGSGDPEMMLQPHASEPAANGLFSTEQR